MTRAESPRSLLYGRTSLDRSDGRSVDDQLTELREWAVREGRTVVAEHRDDGISASRFARGKERPGWRAVLDAVDRGEADELALWEGSRGSRDLVEWVRLVDVCAERGVMIVVRGREHDPRDPDDRERMLSSAVRADHESGVTSKRVTRSVRTRAERGRPHGGPCYGYRSIHDEHTGKFVKRVPDPDTAPYVVEAVERLLAGESAGAVVRDFNARQVPMQYSATWRARDLAETVRRGQSDPVTAPLVAEAASRLAAGESAGTIVRDLNARKAPMPFRGKWRQSNLIQMVRKPAYAGIRSSRNLGLPDDHPADWEPLISRETHDRLMALLADPSRRTVRNGRIGGRLLTGIARCGVCPDGQMRTTSKLYRSRATGEVKPRRVTYQCRECLGVSRIADPVDVYVERVVVNFLSRPDVLDQLADPADDRRALARADAARLRRKLAELEAAMDADDLDVAAGTRLMRSTQDKLEAAEALARPAHVPSVVTDVAGPDAAERWDALGVDQRRAVLRALFTVTIHPTKVRNRFDPGAVTVERHQR